MAHHDELDHIRGLTVESSFENLHQNTKNDLENSDQTSDQVNTRHQWISVAAYYKAQARGFAPGLEVNDWLEAEKDYTELQMELFFSVFEEDGQMTLISLRRLAEAIGVEHPANLHSKVDLIRAIQAANHSLPCFQLDSADLCNEHDGCKWRSECKKMIAVWKR